MLSFSGIITFKNAGDVREAASICPLDRLLVETDAPFLAPQPHRGKPTRPAYVVDTARVVAEERGVDAGVLGHGERVRAKREAVMRAKENAHGESERVKEVRG